MFSLAAEIPVSGEYIDEYFSDMMEFHFDKVKKGYGWIFPKDNYLLVGIGGINAVKSSKPLKSYHNFITGLWYDYVKPSGHFLPIGGIERKICSDRIFLAGDAAGFVDAFIGEGITYAIKSGKLAAEILSMLIKK